MSTYPGKIAPWEQYPKHIRFSEIMDPLSIVINFFSAARPKQHRKELEKWRYFVLTDKCYKDKHGPGSLLFIYDLNVQLIEALHLLLLKHNDKWPRPEDAQHEQIVNEKFDWIYFPKNLSKRELADPYRAINKSFKKISPQEYRDHLHSWLHNALYNNITDDTMVTCEIIQLYYNIRKLYSAAWLIHQRETNQTITYRSLGKFQVDDQATDVTSLEPAKPLKEINPDLSDKEQSVAEKITEVITDRIPAVSMVYLIGKNTSPSIYYLLVLLNDNEKALESEVANKIEDNCRSLVKVFAIVHKVATAKAGLKKEKRFWHNTLYKGITLYKAPEAESLNAHAIDLQVWLEEAETDWKRWGEQGKEFFKGAERYIEDKNYALALFCFHQTVESSLIGVISAVLGYRITAHNLPKMIRLTLLFTDEIKKAFQLNTTDGVQLFNLLQKGYSETRYNSDFTPNAQSVLLLKDKVERLLARIEQVYQQFIKEKSDPLSNHQ